ncbi:MAG TPA: hypothetical protein VK783_07195 [Bacteroidia bacterium]|jgi:hypothetical protein|nr:hypothetical protein [Bacteroidia bacterium]
MNSIILPNLTPTADLAALTPLGTGLNAYVYSPGTNGVGATLTAGSSTAALTVDGQTVGLGTIVLVMGEGLLSTPAPQNNGLYVCTTPGGSTACVLTRHANMNTSVQCSNIAVLVGSSGTSNGNTLWMFTNVPNFSIGVSGGSGNVVFTQVGGLPYSAGTGLSLTGTTFSLTTPVSPTNGGTGLNTSASTGIAQVNSGTWSVGNVGVANGGTGLSSLTAYEPIFGGTTGTGALQQTGLSTAGYVLTSNGSGMLPTFQAIPGAVTSVYANGNSGSSFNFNITANGKSQSVILNSATVTLSFTGLASGGTYTLIVIQDSTGGKTIITPIIFPRL